VASPIEQRPFPLEITAVDFAFAEGHRRMAVSPVAGTLKHLRWPSQILVRVLRRLNTVR
jgi:hypothetical protein